jgi:DNA topoisomerase-1
MENELDEILDGKIIWTDVIKNFYTPFSETLKKAETQMEKIKIPPKLIDENCPNCGKQLAIKRGKFGEFLACSGFPDCRFTKPFIISLDVKCPISGCGGTLLQRKTRKGKVFYGCSNYPKCNFALWDKPLSKNCPICNSFLVEKSRYGKLISENCSNEDCSYLKRL